MISVDELARSILIDGQLDSKLVSYKLSDISLEKRKDVVDVPINPTRSGKIKFSEEQIKFPKKGSFHVDERRALALHFFANHELLAIEMMAAALLKFPHDTEEEIRFKRGLLTTIQDEQKHMKLYIHRMNQFGVEFGDYPLNDFFWRQMDFVKTPSHFYALVALTFESANLDFAKYYEDCFKEVEDFESARIMKIIFEDEITHVALGARWLNQWKGNNTLWKYYLDNLVGHMTPARAKGIHFLKDPRHSAGLDDDFIHHLENYEGDFKVIKRKNW